MKTSAKKCRLRKTLAFIAALSMMGSFSQTIGATKISYNIISAAAENAENNDDDTQKKNSDNNYSKINVQVSSCMSFKDSVPCTVTISKKDGSTILTQNISVGEDTISVGTNDYIANGDYHITVTSDGFVPFEQDIDNLSNSVCTVKVTLGFNPVYSYKYEPQTDSEGRIKVNSDGTVIYRERKSDIHPGVLMYGDLNHDQKINNDDIDLLADAVNTYVRLAEVKESLNSNTNASNTTEESSKSNTTKSSLETEKSTLETKITNNNYDKLQLDWNDDGKVTIEDIGAFTQNYNDIKDSETKATLEQEISEKYIIDNVKVGDVTGKVSGSLDQLIQESMSNDDSNPPTSVTLQPANGGTISEKNPVGFSMPIPDGGDIKEITIATNADTGFVDCEDGNGNTFKVPFSQGKETLPETESNVTATVDSNGNISVNLGNQTAVKKITISITKVKNTKLAEIAEVKMLNGLEKKVSPPPADYPETLDVVQDTTKEDKYAQIDITWKKVVNAPGGYEYEVSTSPATKADGGFTSIVKKNTISADALNSYIDSKTGLIKATLFSEHGNFKLIKTNMTYYVHVRSEGEGSSSVWSKTVSVRTEPQQAPGKPDYVNVKGGTKSIEVSWGADLTNAATSYKLYYGKINPETNEVDEYTEIPIDGVVTKYSITGLEDKAEYSAYVVACNKNGDSPQSDKKKAKTITTEPAQMHKYGAINVDEDGNIGSEHIVDVYRERDGFTKGNDKDEVARNDGQLSTWAVVDGDPNTYYTMKDDTQNTSFGTPHNTGGYVNEGNYSYRAITYEFDKEYEFGSIAVLYPYNNGSIKFTSVYAYDDTNKLVEQYTQISGSLQRKDANGKTYYIVNFPKGIKAKKLKIGFDYGNGSHVAFSEIAFYERGDLKNDIMGLYKDDDIFRLTLKDDVTQEKIDALRKKLKTVDPKTGELHPDREFLTTELDTAEKILKDADSLVKPVEVYNKLTSNTSKGGKAVNYGGLNAWQPLGVSAAAGSEVTVYVGSTQSNPFSSTIGQETNLRLVCTQYNSESNSVVLKTSEKLKIGANTISIPESAVGDAEGGGSLYIVTDCDMSNGTRYSVRVAGGSQIPVLDLYRVTNRNQRIERAKTYIEALDKHVANMEAEHEKAHANSENTQVKLAYKKETCIAGATEILCTQMMYSLPAPQILAGIGGGTLDQRAEQLITSLDAMEDMLTLFYQHKGLVANDGTAYNPADINRVSNMHLNIRYQRMFQGAFMYASGDHIGIQYGSAADITSCKGVTKDANGKYVSGDYFGWGIAHEIGHCINDSNYTVAEITNNYFSLLSTSKDNDKNSRLNYDNIFKRVTSNVKGRADQGTQLGMYWQLHLAYDKGNNYKTYGTQSDIFNNLFYARVDTYSRNKSAADGLCDTPLNLSEGDTDQKLMRLACAAAEKNVLEFFESWGMTPDSITETYASNFPKETRAIMYANEASRLYALDKESKGIESSLKCEFVNATDEDGNIITDNYGQPVRELKRLTEVIDNVNMNVGTGVNANKVTLTFDVSKDKIDSEDILGYEIIRCVRANGDVKESIAGFTKEPKYVDTVTAYNNRTVSYKVVVVDHYLNRSAAYETDWVKISHDGSLDKSHWSVTTSGLEAQTHTTDPDENSQLPCEVSVYDPAVEMIDDKFETIYSPTVTSNVAEIIIDFHQTLEVTGLKYTAGAGGNPIGKYEVFINNGNSEWISVAQGEFKGSNTIYFNATDASYVGTFETSSVKIAISEQNNNTISIAELDVLGVTGDNVDFRQAQDEGKEGVNGEEVKVTLGILDKNYKYADDGSYIPEGSLIFVGSFKGNGAYNVVLLYDEDGYIVGSTRVDDSGKSHQICLSDIKPDAEIGDVANGTWIYWIEPKEMEKMHWPEKVRVELYRVNDAIYNTGQRIVSDTLYVGLDSKDKLNSISLGGGKVPGAEVGEPVEITTATTEEETTTTTTTTSTEETTQPEETTTTTEEVTTTTEEIITTETSDEA
ncbi:MAG: M60 family metallopeptidase [Ruminococcus sp.]|nr:M60 family metallopeptidase [Ruminococcus sp.]